MVVLHKIFHNEQIESLVKSVFIMHFLFQNPNKNFMYTAATLFVNLTNSTDKQNLVPEMVELAKYAKQHIPEEHPKVTT